MKKISSSEQETKKIAEEFSHSLQPGDTVLFYGNLGAGKTTFIQGLADSLGIKDRIISPTFILHRIHKTSNSKIKAINHIDLYRLEEISEIESIGLGELFDDKESIVLIEWADRLKNFLPKSGYKIEIQYLDGDKREININKLNE